MSPRKRCLGMAPAVSALAVSVLACSERGSHVEISARRHAERPSNPAVPGASVQERFEVRREGSMGASDGLPDFEYDLPEGWERLANTRDRYVNLRPAGDPEASCYLSILPGPAGGHRRGSPGPTWMSSSPPSPSAWASTGRTCAS